MVFAFYPYPGDIVVRSRGGITFIILVECLAEVQIIRQYHTHTEFVPLSNH